jgi:hypothetical protein
MREGLFRYLVSVVAVSLAGCALHGGAASGDVRDHSMLTKEQIAENHFNTAFDAVETLRSNWLRVRGGADSFQAPSEVAVYMDDIRLGNTDALKEIAANTVYYIRFFDGVAAQGRWGVGHSGGVIYVSSRPPGVDPASPPPNRKDTMVFSGLRGETVHLVQ